MAEIRTGGEGEDRTGADGATSPYARPTDGGYPSVSAYSNPFAQPGAPVTPPAAAPAPLRRDRAALAKGAGLVAAGLLVGALVTSAFDGGGSAAAASQTPSAASVPGTTQGGMGTQDGTGTQDGSGTPDGTLGGGSAPGGGTGTVPGLGGSSASGRVAGTISAVTGTSVTVEAMDGSTATYTVTSSTQIAKDGQLVEVSDLAAGDTVLVSVTSDDVADRIFVGTGGFGRGMGGSTGQLPGGSAPDTTPDTAPDTTGTTSGTTGSET